MEKCNENERKRHRRQNRVLHSMKQKKNTGEIESPVLRQPRK
jgi:hypothetical protein